MEKKQHEITLRALEPEDLELIFKIENDADLWRWGSTNQPISHYAVRQYLENQQNDIFLDGQLRHVILVDGVPAGIADLTDFQPRHRRAEGGIVVLPQYQRRGVATEALRQLHQYSGERLGVRSLCAYVANENVPAMTLFWHLGYQPSGILPRWLEGEKDATLFQLFF